MPCCKRVSLALGGCPLLAQEAGQRVQGTRKNCRNRGGLSRGEAAGGQGACWDSQRYSGNSRGRHSRRDMGVVGEHQGLGQDLGNHHGSKALPHTQHQPQYQQQQPKDSHKLTEGIHCHAIVSM